MRWRKKETNSRRRRCRRQSHASTGRAGRSLARVSHSSLPTQTSVHRRYRYSACCSHYRCTPAPDQSVPYRPAMTDFLFVHPAPTTPALGSALKLRSGGESRLRQLSSSLAPLLHCYSYVHAIRHAPLLFHLRLRTGRSYNSPSPAFCTSPEVSATTASQRPRAVDATLCLAHALYRSRTLTTARAIMSRRAGEEPGPFGSPKDRLVTAGLLELYLGRTC